MDEKPYCIAYLGRILPVLSETFVVREIAALRSLGARIKPFSLYPPEARVAHPEAPELAREVTVLCRPATPLFWLAHLFFLWRYPRRYWHCLVRYALRAPEPWRHRRRCLAFFAGGPLCRLAPAPRRGPASPRPFRQRPRQPRPNGGPSGRDHFQFHGPRL